MTQLFRAGMIGASQSIRSGALGEAVTLIKRTLGGDASPAPAQRATPPNPFGDMLSDFQNALDCFNPFMPVRPVPAAAARGVFTEVPYADLTMRRAYKLYVPACAEAGVALPLVVMLHGCSQSPDDFAAGTQMNDWAERDGFLVCYPAQSSAANAQRCWNWFKDADQRRGQGEPALVAGITRDVMARHRVDPDRVYVAGLSAGGALAATMGQRYPELYAAVGIHSGLACGAAYDMASAFTAMRDGAGIGTAGAVRVPTIVFHGDRDSTVNPVNAADVVAQAIHTATVEAVSEESEVPGGHAYRRTRFLDGTGRALVERWAIRGAGHAWSGGSASGSYTDPQGPDASGEMLRFFAEHVGPAAAAWP